MRTYGRSIEKAAEAYLRVIEHEGYRQPLGLGEDKKYPWGSNSFILNNMIVLSLAYDFTQDAKYAGATGPGDCRRPDPRDNN